MKTISVTYGGASITGRIYERLRKASWRAIDGMLQWESMTRLTRQKLEHVAYVRGVKDALNEVQFRQAAAAQEIRQTNYVGPPPQVVDRMDFS